MKKNPTKSELKMWIARIRHEQAAGTPEEETNSILAQMVGSWITARDNAAASAAEAANDDE